MEPKEVVDKFRSFVDKDPGDPRFARIGEAYLSMGDLKNALTVLTKGVKANPRYFTGQLILGHALRQAGYLPQARERYRIVLRLDPSNIAAMWQLSAISFEQGNEKDGIRYLKKILLANPYHQIAKEELKNRTGKEYGPPRPPKPKPEIPVPTTQEGPIEVRREEPELAVTEEARETASTASELDDLLSIDVSGEETATAMEFEEEKPVSEEAVAAKTESGESAKPVSKETSSEETEGGDFEELFEMDISEMEVIEEAPEETRAKEAEEVVNPADETVKPEEAVGVVEEKADEGVEQEDKETVSDESYGKTTGLTEAAEEIVEPTAPEAEDDMEELPAEELAEERDVGEEKQVQKDGEEVGFGPDLIEISEDALFFEEETEKPEALEEPTEIGADESEKVSEEPAQDQGDTKEPEPTEPKIEVPDESEPEPVLEKDFEGELESIELSATERPESGTEKDEERTAMEPSEIIEVSSPEELAKLIGAEEEKEAVDIESEEIEIEETDLTEPEITPEDITSLSTEIEEVIEELPETDELAEKNEQVDLESEAEVPTEREPEHQIIDEKELGTEDIDEIESVEDIEELEELITEGERESEAESAQEKNVEEPEEELPTFGSIGDDEESQPEPQKTPEDAEETIEKAERETRPETVEEDPTERATEESAEDVEENVPELQTRKEFAPPGESEAEKITGLQSRKDFEPPAEDEDLDTEIEGLEVKKEFEPGVDATEEIEGLETKKEFEPEAGDLPEPPESDKSSETPETVEDEESEEADVYTMTMAEIYAAQGQIEKAIWIYEQILPETDDEEDRERIEERVKYLKRNLEETE